MFAETSTTYKAEVPGTAKLGYFCIKYNSSKWTPDAVVWVDGNNKFNKDSLENIIIELSNIVKAMEAHGR